jgi:hypothetical protein
MLDVQIPELIDRSSYPDTAGLDRARSLRLVTGLKCLGRSSTAKAVADAGVQLALGLDSASVERLRQFGETTTPAMDEACLRLWLTILAEREEVGPVCLAELIRPDTVHGSVLLLREPVRDTWLFAAPLAEESAPDLLERGLALVREATGVRPDWLLLAPSLRPHLAPRAFDPSELWADSETGAVPDVVRGARRAFDKRPHAARDDLRYLTIDEQIAGSPFDLTWSVIAHGVLRAFARRLIGFGGSSFDYLYHNFLAGVGSVGVDGATIDVELPPVPLLLVLRMAGIYDQTLAVPWLDGARVRLRPPAD